MGIFDRIKRLIKSNVHSTFDTRTVEDLLNSGDEELKRIIEELSGNKQQSSNSTSNGQNTEPNQESSSTPPRQEQYTRTRSSQSTGRTSSNTNNRTTSPQQQALLRAYSRLGVRSTSTNDEIKSAYRKMIKLYHPDRVAQLDKTKQDEAKRIAQEINVAYDLLQKVRGFS
jgi:DnaJ-domain-containing protein 1